MTMYDDSADYYEYKLRRRAAAMDMLLGSAAILIGLGLTAGSCYFDSSSVVIWYGAVAVGVWRFLRGWTIRSQLRRHR